MDKKKIIIIIIVLLLTVAAVTTTVLVFLSNRNKIQEMLEDVVEEPENTGDVALTINTEAKLFTNEDDFIQTVPASIRRQIHDDIPIECFGVPSEVTFISYEDGVIHATKREYNVEIYKYGDYYNFREVVK